MFPGFPERLRKELQAIAPDKDIDLVAPPERKYLYAPLHHEASGYAGLQYSAGRG